MPGIYLTLDELGELERQTGDILVAKVVSAGLKLFAASGIAFLGWFGVQMHQYHQELNAPVVVSTPK